MKMFYKIFIILITTISLFCITIFFIAKNNNQINLTKINIVVAPSDTILELDGKPIQDGLLNTSSGKHFIIARRSNFIQQTLVVTVEKNKTTDIFIALNPKDIIGQDIVKKQNSLFLEIGSKKESQANQNSKMIQKKYPIIKKLPIIMSSIFRIDYGVSKKYPDDPLKIALYISADSPHTRQNALYYIQNMGGYDPSDYEIIFQPLYNTGS